MIAAFFMSSPFDQIEINMLIPEKTTLGQFDDYVSAFSNSPYISIKKNNKLICEIHNQLLKIFVTPPNSADFF